MKLRWITFLAFGVALVFSIKFIHRRFHAQAVYAAPAQHSTPTSYLLSPEVLASMRDSANETAIRAHAWAILSSLTADGTAQNPLWESPEWSSKRDLCLGNAPCSAHAHNRNLLALDIPIQSFVETTAVGNPSKHAFEVSSVLYDPDAAGFIRTKKLAAQKTWVDLNHSPDSASLQTSLNFPVGSIIVKEMWESIPVCDPGTQLGHGCYAIIPVFDSSKVKPGTQPLDWLASNVAVNTDPNIPCDFQKQYPYVLDGSQPPASQWIPISCFHYRKVGPGVDASVAVNSGQIVNNVATPEIGQYIVLVGFHLITAELPDWTWSTFWWTKPDVDTGGRAGQPDSIAHSATWALYSMDTMLSGSKPTNTPGAPRIIYNPYLEGPQKNGTDSNCITCHSHAVFRNGVAGYVADDISNSLKPRCLQIDPANTGCTTDTFRDDADFFSGATRTHMLWSLATKQDPGAVNVFSDAFRQHFNIHPAESNGHHH